MKRFACPLAVVLLAALPSLSAWGVVLADTKGTGQIVLHHFDNSHGAKSWRVSHPHPAFSADGKRIYFNVSDGEFTRLFAAERPTP